MARLPKPGGDVGNWGVILNNFLLQSLTSDGSLKSSSISSAGGEMLANKGVSGGYASLDSSGNVPASELGNGVTSVNNQKGDVSLIASDVSALSDTTTLNNIPVANGPVSLNNQTITNVANGSNSNDVAAFGQIPTSVTQFSDFVQEAHQNIGPSAYTMSGSSMRLWLNKLGHSIYNFGTDPTGPAILIRLTDSYGQDYVNSWHSFDEYMYNKYNGTFVPQGMFPINTGFGWGFAGGTVQGTTLGLNRGINGYAQQMSSGQQCVSPAVFTDGVLFQWLADSGSTSTGLLLQVDGSTVQTVDGSKNGSYYYAMPNGAGSHTIGYVNNSVTSVTVDTPYVYLDNRSSGYQAWDISHTGNTTSDFSTNLDLPYYFNAIQPSAIIICTQQNDPTPTDYQTAIDTLAQTIAAQVTIPPSLAVYSNYAASGRSSVQPEMQAVAQSFAVANNAALMDMYPIVGNVPNVSGAVADSMGWTIDGVHPSPATREQIISPAAVQVFDLPSVPRGPILNPTGVIVTSDVTYSLTGNESKLIFTSSSAVTVKVNDLAAMMFFGQSSVFIGQTVEVIQAGTGVVTVSASNGSVVSVNGSYSTAGQYSRLSLTAISATQWLVDSSAAPA